MIEPLNSHCQEGRVEAKEHDSGMRLPVAHDKIAEVGIISDEHASVTMCESENRHVRQAGPMVCRDGLGVMTVESQMGNDASIRTLVDEELYACVEAPLSA